MSNLFSYRWFCTTEIKIVLTIAGAAQDSSYLYLSPRGMQLEFAHRGLSGDAFVDFSAVPRATGSDFLRSRSSH
jgi:hypothetical protein